MGLGFAVLWGLAMTLACAETELTVSAYLDPGDFVEPGPSLLTVLLYNPTEYPAKGVALSPSEKQQGQQIGDIAPGESARFEYEMTVAQKALNAGGVDVFVNCTINGQRVRQQISAPVRQVAALAQAEFSRRASAAMVRAGEEIRLTYTLNNVGEVGLENVVIFDSLDNYSFPAFALGPGETRELTRTVAVENSAVSRVSASFTSALSGSQYYLYAEEMTVNVRADEVRVLPAAETPVLAYGQPGRLTLAVENMGPYNYTSVALSEPTLGRIPFVPAALRVGERFTAEVALPAQTREREYRFALTLRDENGTASTIYAEPIVIAVELAGERSVRLAAAVAASTDAEGDVAFLLTLNTGAEALYDVEIGEKTLGVLRRLAVAPAAAETSVYLPCRAVADGKYEFYASFAAPDGTQTVYAEPVSATPSAGRGDAGRNNPLETLVLAVAQKLKLAKGAVYGGVSALVLLAIGAVTLVIRRQRSRRKALKSITNKFVPVHAKTATKEKE